LGARGKPRFRPLKRLIPAGTKLRLSSLHRLQASDPGDGLLGPDARGRTYRLILDCPGRSSLNGLFVRTEDLGES
jgi:hypothetical protein